MPKPITLEMLQAMSLDQRKILRRNATGMDTPASRAVLEMLAQDGLMDAPKVAKAPAARKTTSKPASRKTKAPAAPNAKTAIFGRQA